MFVNRCIENKQLICFLGNNFRIQELSEDNEPHQRQPKLHVGRNYQLVYVKSKVNIFVYERLCRRQHRGYDNSSSDIYVPAN